MRVACALMLSVAACGNGANGGSADASLADARAGIDAPIAFDAGSADAATIDAPTIDAPSQPIDAAGLDAAPAPTCSNPVSGTPALVHQQVAGNLTAPIVIVIPPGETRFFVAEKGGRVRIIEANGAPRATDFLDLRDRVSRGSEQGLLGMAFHPGYAQNGRFFVSFTDTNGDSRVWEYRVSADRNVAETQEFEIFFQDQPASNHNGGQILFGPDGKLYIALGDGGGQYDPSGNGQKLTTFLGKVLRIDVDVERPQKYAIPDDNPYAGDPDPEVKQEIWVRGLRNPWRMSFDRATGEAWIGDVGQDRWEEIDHVPAGAKGLNFGWGVVEGKNHCPREDEETCTLEGATLPVHEYRHDDGCNAIAGGFVYRGCIMPDLRGTYFYSDNGCGQVWSFRPGAGAPTEHRTHEGLERGQPATWGEDLDGELVYCSLGGAGSGRCYRVAPAL